MLFLTSGGCGVFSDSSGPGDRTDSGTGGQASSGSSVLRLASTTSTRDSGLLDLLLPIFEQAHDCRVDLLAMGTGAALKTGQTGDVDVLLVHARAAEETFMTAGHGIRHEPVMHNSFLIVGPAGDPANVSESDVIAALQAISTGGHRYLSRGDDSGTHQREQSLWERAGGRPDWNRYLESGQGMGPTLVMADELQAYVLVDHGTWLKQAEKLELVPVVTEGQSLENPYAAIVVNPRNHSAVNTRLASLFVDFLISEQTQKLIMEYTIRGQTLFYPDRMNAESAE
ncbi:MAG: substrate-binding domain-containing protein [Planctomycetaceae bacterium]